MFKVSWIRSATPDVIINGFKAAGIYPFNRNAIPPSKIKVSGENLEPSVIEHPGLPVEPLSFSSSSRDQIVSQPSFPAVHHAPSAVTISSSPVVPFVSSGIGPSSQVDHAPSVVAASSSPIVPSVPCSSSHIDFITFSPVQHPSSLSTPSRETSTSADATFSSPLLKELERAVSKETIDKWNRRYVEGYDLKDDHLYNAWKMTKDQITSKRSYTITSKRGAVTIDEDIADILARPSKLKAATATKKRTGGMPDPSNKELTGSFLQEFQEAIDQEIDRKKKIAEAKEERKKKKEKDEKEKAERKKRREEERLKKAVDKENKQQQKKPVSKASGLWTDMYVTSPSPPKTKIKFSFGKGKKKGNTRQILREYAKNNEDSDDESTEEVQEEEEWVCGGCGGRYVEKLKQPWIECDFCSAWYHQLCTSIPSRETGNHLPFTCPSCEKGGHESHRLFYGSSTSSSEEN